MTEVAAAGTTMIGVLCLWSGNEHETQWSGENSLLSGTAWCHPELALTFSIWLPARSGFVIGDGIPGCCCRWWLLGSHGHLGARFGYVLRERIDGHAVVGTSRVDLKLSRLWSNKRRHKSIIDMAKEEYSQHAWHIFEPFSIIPTR